jgi:hypothetical protein
MKEERRRKRQFKQKVKVSCEDHVEGTDALVHNGRAGVRDVLCARCQALQAHLGVCAQPQPEKGDLAAHRTLRGHSEMPCQSAVTGQHP